MFVKYIGPSHTRAVPKEELGYEVAEGDLEVNFVWDDLNEHVVEMNAEAYEQLQLKTSRGEWTEVVEMPELPTITSDELQSINDDDTLPVTGQEPPGSVEE